MAYPRIIRDRSGNIVGMNSVDPPVIGSGDAPPTTPSMNNDINFYARVNALENKAHLHTNFAVLNKIGESSGLPTWNGGAWPGGSGGGGGTTWLASGGTPSVNIGLTGDFYLDTASGNVFHKATTWGTPVMNLKGSNGLNGTNGTDGATGPQGHAGQTIAWHTGVGNPSSNLGADGDMYLDTANGSVFKKVSGAYAIQCNITGPQGPIGLTGTTGPQGPQGLPGTDGAQGPQGDTGPAGPIGPAGPTGTQGIKGDTGADGAQGPQGPAGPQGPTGATGSNGAGGVGVPAGGSTGQILSKIDNTDYNTQWINAPSGGGGGGSSVTTKKFNPNGDATASYIVTSGGNVALTKFGSTATITRNGDTLISASIWFSSTEVGTGNVTIDFDAGGANDYTDIFPPQFQAYTDLAGSRAMRSTAAGNLNTNAHTLQVSGLTTGAGVWVNLSF